MAKKQIEKYDASSIDVFEGLEGVRAKPSMYMGERGNQMVGRCFKEAVDNSLDEMMAGRNDTIECIIDNEKSIYIIADSGVGIPVEKHAKTKISTLTTVLTRLHAGGKMRSSDTSSYGKGSVGTHGVGVSATNALSEKFDVWTNREGKWYTQSFAKGVEKTQVKQIKTLPKELAQVENKKFGTIIKFTPDQSIVAEGKTKAVVEIKQTIEWLNFLAQLNPGLKVIVKANIKGEWKEKKFFNKEGLQSLVADMLVKKEVEALGKPFIHHNDTYSIAIQWSSFSEDTGIQSFVSCSPTKDGGKHVDGFASALVKSLAKFKSSRDKFGVKELLFGAIGVFNYRMSEPEFDSQLKHRLTSKVDKIIEEDLTPILEQFFAKNKSLAKSIIKRANDVKKSKEELSKHLKAISDAKKGSRSGLMLPGKLFTSPRSKPENRELFIVEGDSAGGISKHARNPDFQEVLKLTGKFSNAIRTNTTELLKNERVLDILTSLGFDFNAFKDGTDPLSKLRIGRILLLSDADVDGPLRGDTKVLTLDGRNPTIEQLTNEWNTSKQPIWVYGRNQSNTLVPVEAFAPKKVKTVSKMVKLTLDSGTPIHCSLDHKWKLKNPSRKDSRIIWSGKHGYVCAKDLTVGDSIDSQYFELTNADGAVYRKGNKYLSILEESSKTPVHRWVMAKTKPKTYAKYKLVNKGQSGGILHIHHKDEDSLNNSPDNLAFISKEDHYGVHGSSMALQYNGSMKHKRDLKAFNKSIEGKKLSKLHSVIITEYNKSDKHRETVSESNKDSTLNLVRMLGKCRKLATILRSNGYSITKKNWNRFTIASKNKRGINVPKWENLPFTKSELTKHSEVDGYFLVERKGYANPNQKWGNFVSLCKKTILEFETLSESTYNKCRELQLSEGRRFYPKWETIKEHALHAGYKSVKEAYKVKSSNHIVKSISIYDCEKTPVYCMTVPKTGNFMVDDGNGNGVCSSNSHINVLILCLLYKFAKPLFDMGMVYIVEAPLFHAFYKNKHYYGENHQDVAKQLPKGASKALIVRSKGWGEISIEVLREVAFNPDTRKIRRILPVEGKDATYFEYITGSDSAARKQLLGIS